MEQVCRMTCSEQAPQEHPHCLIAPVDLQIEVVGVGGSRVDSKTIVHQRKVAGSTS